VNLAAKKTTQLFGGLKNRAAEKPKKSCFYFGFANAPSFKNFTMNYGIIFVLSV